MKRLFSKKYKALGFVEALIAIMVSGIVATVLINISVIAMRELVRLDIEDDQAQYARSASVVVQNIADRERVKEDSIYFDNLTDGNCYTLTRTDEVYDIDHAPVYNFSDRNSYKDAAIITDGISDSEPDYFRLVCIVKNRPNNTNKLLIKVVIGFNKVQGSFSTTSDIRDYQYFAIINL